MERISKIPGKRYIGVAVFSAAVTFGVAVDDYANSAKFTKNVLKNFATLTSKKAETIDDDILMTSSVIGIFGTWWWKLALDKAKRERIKTQNIVVFPKT